MEKITYWLNGKLVSKKFSNEQDIKRFVIRNKITQYYWCGYCFMVI